MAAPLGHLPSPLKPNHIELRNQIVSTGHGLGCAEAGSNSGDRFVGYYEARAKGDLGLCIIGATMVHPNSPPIRGLLQYLDDSCSPGYRRVSEAVHRHGGRIFTQITHFGRLTVVERGHAYAGSAVPDEINRVAAHDLDGALIEKIVVAYDAVEQFIESPLLSHSRIRFKFDG